MAVYEPAVARCGWSRWRRSAGDNCSVAGFDRLYAGARPRVDPVETTVEAVTSGLVDSTGD